MSAAEWVFTVWAGFSPIAGMLIGWLLHSLCNGRPVDVIYRLDDTSHFHITAPNVSGAIKLIGTLSERP